MKDILNKFTIWLATKLDALKVGQPVLFLFIQAVLVFFASAFADNTINIPTPEFVGKVLALFGLTDIDQVFTIVLIGLVSLIGPRTSFLKTKGEELKAKG